MAVDKQVFKLYNNNQCGLHVYSRTLTRRALEDKSAIMEEINKAQQHSLQLVKELASTGNDSGEIVLSQTVIPCVSNYGDYYTDVYVSICSSFCPRHMVKKNWIQFFVRGDFLIDAAEAFNCCGSFAPTDRPDVFLFQINQEQLTQVLDTNGNAITPLTELLEFCATPVEADTVKVSDTIFSMVMASAITRQDRSDKDEELDL